MLDEAWVRGTRLIATLRDPALADEAAFRAVGDRLFAWQPGGDKLHLITPSARGLERRSDCA